MPMNPDVKAKWLAALRSGEYKQAKRRLRDELGGYCCLGVLCDISGLAEWRAPGPEDPYKYMEESNLLPLRVADYAGTEVSPECSYNGQVDTLANWNDNGLSFSEIADIIEREL